MATRYYCEDCDQLFSYHNRDYPKPAAFCRCSDCDRALVPYGVQQVSLEDPAELHNTLKTFLGE